MGLQAPQARGAAGARARALACALVLLAVPVVGQPLGPTWLWAAQLISPWSPLGGASHSVTDVASGPQGSAFAVGKVYELCYSRNWFDCAGDANNPSTSTDFGYSPGMSNLSNAAFMTKVRRASAAPAPAGAARRASGTTRRVRLRRTLARRPRQRLRSSPRQLRRRDAFSRRCVVLPRRPGRRCRRGSAPPLGAGALAWRRGRRRS